MIDWSRAKELREEVGAEEFEEVVELFLEEVDEVVARLRASPDPNTYEEDLHFLKGSALNLGFAALGDLCQQGESAAHAGNQDQVDIGPILDCFDASRAAFMSGMESNLAA